MQAATYLPGAGLASGRADRVTERIRGLTGGGRSVAPAAALALMVAAATGAIAVALRPSAAPLVAVGVALFALSLSWRRGVVLMLLALPFSGRAGVHGRRLLDRR